MDEATVRTSEQASVNEGSERLEKGCSSLERLKILLQSRQFPRLYRAVLRGAIIGLIGRGGLHVIASIVSTIRGRPARGMGVIVGDTLRWSAFFGCYGGVFVSVDEGLRHFIGEKRSARWRAGVAGAAAGPTILLTGLKLRHDDLALYMLLRGVTLLIRCGNKASAPAWLRTLLTPTRWQHGDTALMCAATWQIIYSYVMHPETLPSSYVRFLNQMAGMQNWLVPVAKELALRNASMPNLQAPLKLLAGTPHAHLMNPSFCEILHNGKDCNEHFLSIIPSLTQRSLAVYIPVYVASAIAVHRVELLLKPWPIIKKMALGTARSSLFLGVYVALAHRAICLAAGVPMQPGNKLTPAKMAVVAWLPGLATLIEKKSRRMELAFYCLGRVFICSQLMSEAVWEDSCPMLMHRTRDGPGHHVPPLHPERKQMDVQAILAFYKGFLQWKVAPVWMSKLRTDVLAFTAAAACIMHCYGDSYGEHRDIFRSKYLNVLDFLYGSRGLAHGAVSHSISNRELLEAARKHTRVRLRTFSDSNLRALMRRDAVKVDIETNEPSES